MTTTSIELLEQLTATAVASYGSLDRGSDLKSNLIDPNGDANFTSTQADTFVAKYKLLDQLPNVPGNGFSATVFEDRQHPGKHVIAMRGTEQPVADLFVTDGLSIGGNGFANNQAVEMIRYYKRLTTAGGQAVRYTDQEMWQLFAIKNSLLVPLAPFPPTLAAGVAEDFQLFKRSLAQDRGVVPPPGSASTSVLSATERVDVTGHSLGGHLAILFARFFPDNVDQVVTLNAPGLFPQGDYALAKIGFPPPDNGRITRIEADGDGISEIGTVWPGSTIRIAQENDSGAVAALGGNHSSVNGNDSLALMTMLAKLDPRRATDANGLSRIERVASNVVSATFENTLDRVREILLGRAAPRTAVSSGAADPKRSALYDNMKALLNSAAFSALAGRVLLSPADSVTGTGAKSDFASLLTLLDLSPVAIKAAGSDVAATVEAALAINWSSEHANWLADRSLSQADRDAGKLNFTDAFFDDRSAMLKWLVTRNETDIVVLGAGNRATPIHYRDAASGTEFDIGVPNALVDTRQTLFGGDSAEALSGKRLADHLYGGAGKDTLTGHGGGDYLEGNADINNLDGRDGDHGLGGALGNDQHNGCEGSDTHTYAFARGADAIGIAGIDDTNKIKRSGGNDVLFGDANSDVQSLTTETSFAKVAANDHSIRSAA